MTSIASACCATSSASPISASSSPIPISSPRCGARWSGRPRSCSARWSSPCRSRSSSNEDFYGRGLARVIIMLPWAVSLTMTAIVWRWALNGESGMLNSGLRGLGLIERQHPVAGAGLHRLSDADPDRHPGLDPVHRDDLPRRPVVGAGRPLRRRRDRGAPGAGSSSVYITLPLLRPFINIAFVLNTIYVFNSFPIIWATTQGGPANSTDILVTYLYKLGFRLGQARRSVGGVADHVRDPARLHPHLCAAGDARGEAA